MSWFKLNQNWNGHFAGDTVNADNRFDTQILRDHIGTKVDAPAEAKIVIKAENKMIVPEYPNTAKGKL